MADQGAEGLLSPYLRKKRIQAVAPWIKGRVLDFGCGAGLLATLVPADQYLGFDIDLISLDSAKKKFSAHKFTSNLTLPSQKFDTVAALAVIEHVNDQVKFLSTLAGYLANDLGNIVLTTPHPSIEWLHSFGARIGLFSRHANDEHEDLLNYFVLKKNGEQAGLRLQYYSRFLFGANQIVVYSKEAK